MTHNRERIREQRSRYRRRSMLGGGESGRSAAGRSKAAKIARHENSSVSSTSRSRNRNMMYPLATVVATLINAHVLVGSHAFVTDRNNVRFGMRQHNVGVGQQKLEMSSTAEDTRTNKSKSKSTYDLVKMNSSTSNGKMSNGKQVNVKASNGAEAVNVKTKDKPLSPKHQHEQHIASGPQKTPKERIRSEARLEKARRMLDEFLMDPTGTFVEAQAPGLELDGADTGSVMAVAHGKKKKEPWGGTGARASSSSSIITTTSTASTGAPKMNSSPIEYTKGGTEIVLPDSFWYNGNLESGSGDFVTRWQRGVKVAEPLRKYDPAVAEKVLFRQPNRWVIRNVQIALPIGLWAAGVVADVITGSEKRNRKNRAKQLLKTINGLGPAIIKAGQALSSRSDLLPSEYLDELQKLQDDVPRFPNEKAFATVKEELGSEFNEIFELIGTEPVAAASIGQVYKARLLSNGETVAIKIQRPKCEEIIALDLYVLRWWSNALWNRVAGLLNRDIDFSSIIDDFGELIYREIDYVAEAANAQRFNELYSGVTDVFVPKVYSELTTSKVLTMEWIDGFRLTDSKMLEAYNLDRKKLVDTLVQCSLRQILENGFFHADPHGGNLLACEDGRLCYLDFGMMSYAAAKQRNGFLLAVVHIVNRDWGELARLYVNLGFIPEGTDLRPIELALEDALPDVLSSSVNELNFKNVVSKLGDIMYTYPFSLPPFYIAIIRCLGVLEGLAIQVDPSSRVISKAYPYIASRVLTDPQDELQEAFRRLAFTSDGHIRWSRLEGLLEEAKDTEGYDVTLALDQLSDYLISDDGEQLLNDLAEQIVEGADGLGSETVNYVLDASRALLTNDDAGAARALRSLQSILERSSSGGGGGGGGVESVGKEIRDNLSKALPEPTPSMQRFWRIALLLGARGSRTDPSKFVPLVRKLSQEPRVQRAVNEIVARLGERALSRTLRAAFGLPPPEFDQGSSKAVVAGE